MPLQIIRNDITKMSVDAIVNAANTSLLGGGGVDGCIHRSAGPELLAECSTLHGCETGSAKITKGYHLPCKYVIHAVGPRWRDGKHREQELLESCYRTSLNLAKENGCQSVAFPLISSGIYGYPKDQALRVAVDTISMFLMENEMMVYIVIFDKKAYQISGKLFADIEAYIDDRYVEGHTDSRAEQRRRLEALAEESCFEAAPATLSPEAICKSCSSQSLEEALGQIDESFSEMLLRKIDESGMTDAQCYKKANIDAVETASQFGIGADRAVNYQCDSEGTALNYEVVSEAISSVRWTSVLRGPERSGEFPQQAENRFRVTKALLAEEWILKKSFKVWKNFRLILFVSWSRI